MDVVLCAFHDVYSMLYIKYNLMIPSLQVYSSCWIQDSHEAAKQVKWLNLWFHSVFSFVVLSWLIKFLLFGVVF